MNPDLVASRLNVLRQDVLRNLFRLFLRKFKFLFQKICNTLIKNPVWIKIEYVFTVFLVHVVHFNVYILANLKRRSGYM
jgi:hypothetical protein